MRYVRSKIDADSVIDVKAIIKAGLAMRALERTNEYVSSSDFTIRLAEVYSDWTAEFIDTILDYAERDLRVARRFRTWRRRVAPPRARS
jgi:predicted RecB family nuclease